MKIVTILLVLSVFGCATKPTEYRSMKKQEGYKERVVENDLLSVTFKANSSTKKERAELFAKFRAIESCQEKGKSLTHILDVVDKTRSQQVTKTDSIGPAYYYGMSPFYGRYYGAGWGMGMGFNTVSTRSWNETYTYPEYEVFFQCVNDVKDARIYFKQISAETMKILVKDLKGSLQVERVLDDSPNKGAIEVGDIILKVNGERIESVLELFRIAKNKTATLDILREGEKKKVSLKLIDVSNIVKETQNGTISAACGKDKLKEKREICKSI